METLAILVLLVLVGMFVYFPRTLMVLAAVTCLAVACSRAEAALRFEVSVVVETYSDGPTMEEAVAYATRLYHDQLGIDLTVTRMDVTKVADGTTAQTLLDAVQAYKLAHPAHRAANATVLFTRRDIRQGATDYGGVATTGQPNGAAIVELRGDKLDGQILAHELAHTLGIPHDHVPGYIMSEHLGRGEATYFSAAQQPTGGGGAISAMEAFLWLLIAGAAFLLRWLDIRRQAAVARAQYAEDTLKLLEPPAVADIMSVTAHSDTRGSHWLGVQFATLSGLNQFRGWLEEEHRRAVVRVREQIDKAVK